MGRYAHAFGPDHAEATYVSHLLPEQTFDTGEVEFNYAVAGSDDKPALLLIPGQSESWWGYEAAMPLLAPAPPEAKGSALVCSGTPT